MLIRETPITMCRTELDLLFLCVLCFAIQSGISQSTLEGEVYMRLACAAHEQCGPCLAAPQQCRWCADIHFLGNGTAPRCSDEKSLIEARCSNVTIQAPRGGSVSSIEEAPLVDREPGDSSPAVQITPQRIRVELRPHESQTIKFTYRPARNYPLDLYYLMDLTWSMRDDKETLVSLSGDLASMLQNLTNDYTLGFGSFADKPVMPYVRMEPDRRANPCAIEGGHCEAAYGFQHRVRLSPAAAEWARAVDAANVTANVDNAEAGLDALAQAALCEEVLGWRKQSRKIIIFATDGLLHFAGDGKLGGIIERFDARCHLDENGLYADSERFDYPSLELIKRILDSQKINVIFAVTQDVKRHYDQLNELMVENTYLGTLEGDSSNILNLVKKGYEDIVSVINFKDDSDGTVELQYRSDCGRGGAKMETSRCTDVHYGHTYDFEINITLDSCPSFKHGQKRTIVISETQLGQESVVLEVELLCGCDCEGVKARADAESEVGHKCPLNAQMTCGQCQCLEDWSGPNCDCDASNQTVNPTLSAACRNPNSLEKTFPCSGSGDCVCGACICDRGYSGKYCECLQCQTSPLNGLECGGPEYGVCACGSCACRAGWTGPACACTSSTERCRSPAVATLAALATPATLSPNSPLQADGDLCSNNGKCVCGECECDIGPFGERYVGTYCESCANCDNNPLCATAEPCVACALRSNCTEGCEERYRVTIDVQQLNAYEDENSNEGFCLLRMFEDNMQCDYRYRYRAAVKADSPGATTLVRVYDKTCSRLLGAKLMTSGLVIASLVILVGVILIIGIKVTQMAADRRAYARFVREAEQSMKEMSNQNPLYKSPVTSFTVPEEAQFQEHKMD